MSLSREIALADDETLEQIFTALAKEVLAKNLQHRKGKSGAFNAWLRPHFRALHAGGMSKERLRELQKLSRQVYRKTRESMPRPQAESLAIGDGRADTAPFPSEKPARNEESKSANQVRASDAVQEPDAARHLHSGLPDRVFVNPGGAPEKRHILMAIQQNGSKKRTGSS